MKTDDLARTLLGEYGGPMLGYCEKENLFVVFEQFDAPCGSERIATGKTVNEALQNAVKPLAEIVKKREKLWGKKHG